MGDNFTPFKKATKDEIESHSSALTNKRIDSILQELNIIELTVNNAFPPSVQHVMPYHSILYTLWNETNSFYNNFPDLQKQILLCVSDGEKAMLFLKYTNPQYVQQYHVEWLIKNCKKLRFLMHRGLQQMGYFYRFSKRDPSSIEEHIKIFEQKKWNIRKVNNEVRQDTKLPREAEKGS